MKSRLTAFDLEAIDHVVTMLDELRRFDAVHAERVVDLRRSMRARIVKLLAIEAWDRDKLAIVDELVAEGSTSWTEEFLERLGVAKSEARGARIA